MRLIVVEEDGFYYLFLVLRAALILGHHKFEGGALSNALFFFYIEKRLILELRLNVLISFCDLSLEHSLGSRVGTVVRALV